MRNAKCRKLFGAILILSVAAALACGKKPQAPAAEEKTVPGTAPGGEAAPGAALAASAFELKMRILEGGREKPYIPNRPVTSSYLEFLTFANFEDEENVATDEQIKKVFSLTDIGLLTETTLVWEKGRTEKAFHIFRINGQAYLVMVTPGRVPERNQFRIEVYEQSGDEMKASLLNTEFSLPEKSSAVFGFENSKLKSYFITLRVARWLGEPAAEGVAGGVAGGVVPGVLKSGEKVKPPKLVKEVAPVYPEAAKKGGIEGVVILEATTDTYGRVASVKILRGDPLLGQAAVEALEQWVYEPMVINGKPKPVVFTVTMRFTLDEKNKPEVRGVVGGVAGGVEAVSRAAWPEACWAGSRRSRTRSSSRATPSGPSGTSSRPSSSSRSIPSIPMRPAKPASKGSSSSKPRPTSRATSSTPASSAPSPLSIRRPSRPSSSGSTSP